MSVIDVSWNGGEAYDVHVLAGHQSQKPIDQLVLRDSADPDPSQWRFQAQWQAGTTVTFFGEFAGAPGPAHGVTVDQNTGAVTVSAAPLPTPHLNNFLIRAEISDLVNGVFATKLHLRVHVHTSVVNAWLTPATLDVHVNANDQRFGVLAEFDDRTVGDLTRLPGIQWSSADPTRVAVDPATGKLSANVAGVTTPVSITATLPAAFGTWTPAAGVRTLAPWSTPRVATLVPGSPGVSVMADVPNILFIPDGFTAAHAQEGEFRKIVLKTVKFLRKDQRTSPWDLLKHSINFWMVWIESQEPGCTVLGEIVPVTSGGTLQGEPMPERKAPSAPGASPPPWTLEEMLNEVGLPIPADALVSLQPAAIAVQMLAKINDWTTLYGAKVTGRISLTNYTAWSLRADRRLLDERNTGLGIAVGGRPNAENPIRSAMSLMSGLRTSRAQLDDMLSALTDGKGNTIGATWVTGKDRSRVFALLGGTRGAGAESETLIASTVVSKLDPVKGTGLVDFDHVLLGPGVNGGRSMAVIPHPLPKTLSFGAVFTVAHETAHSQHLGDEYGATGRIASTTAVDDLNLQDELSAMAPTPFGGPAITLNGTRLKWLWPRIEKAGALAATPVANTSGGFDLSLRSGHAAVFNPGDEIQVRERPLTPGPRTSDVLVVQTVTKSKLVATPKAAPVTTSPVTFGKGSVVYKPKVRAGAPLMLVADLIRDWITFTGMPLNASGTSWTCGAGGRSVGVQPANNLPTTGLRTHHPKYTAWIVGLYEGGKDFQCGIYHPTGACMMRINVPYQQRPLPSVASWAYRFCPVCRYVLVDALDPSKHGANDAWFDTRYPV